MIDDRTPANDGPRPPEPDADRGRGTVTLTLFNAPLRDQREYEHLCEVRLTYRDALYIAAIGARRVPAPEVAVIHLRIEVERSVDAIDLATPQDVQLQPGDAEALRGFFDAICAEIARGMPEIFEKMDRLVELQREVEGPAREPWQGEA